MGAEYFSKRGWFERGELRVRPSDTSYLYFNYQGMVDRGIGSPPQNQGGEDALFRAERPFGTFRGVAKYRLSEFVHFPASPITDVYSQAVDSEVRSQIFLSNTTNGFHFNALAERYQNFESAARAPSRPCARFTSPRRSWSGFLHTPSVFISARSGNWATRPCTGRSRAPPKACSVAKFPQDRSCRWVFGTPIWWADSISRRRSRCLCNGRDGHSVPLLFCATRFYTEEFNATFANATGKAAGRHSDRKSLEASIEFASPSLSRVFDHPWLGRNGST